MKNLEPWVSQTIFAGQRYGRYTVISTHRRKGTYKYYALCQCDCGSEQRYVYTSALREGDAQSCGCLHKERVTKHGAWNHPLFNVWRGMMQRCHNKNDKRYSRYGGRGITVCDRWHDVNAFIRDMEPTFKTGLQIDRIDNDKGYSPENCKWSTTREQTRNYSRNVVIEHTGKRLCVADWSEITGIPSKVIYGRISAGWNHVDAITKKVMAAKESSAVARKIRWPD